MAGIRSSLGRAPSPQPLPQRWKGSWYTAVTGPTWDDQLECPEERRRREALHEEEQQLWADFRNLKEAQQKSQGTSHGPGRYRSDWELFEEVVLKHKQRKTKVKGMRLGGIHQQDEARMGVEPLRAVNSRLRSQPFLDVRRSGGEQGGVQSWVEQAARLGEDTPE